MNKIFFLIIFIASSCASTAQNIIYDLPQTVTNELRPHITNYASKSNQIQAIKLTTLDAQYYLITIFEVKKDTSDIIYSKLIRNSTRLLRIDNFLLPIITDEDLTFADFGSVIDSNEKTGKRRIGRKKVIMNLDGFTVKFNKAGQIIEK